MSRLSLSLVVAIVGAWSCVVCASIAACVGDPPEGVSGAATDAGIVVIGDAQTLAPGQFALQIPAERVEIVRGNKKTVTITVARNSFGGAIQFGLAGSSPDVIVTGFAPAETPSTGLQFQTAQITIDVTSAPQLATTITVTGVSGAVSATSPLALLVRDRPGTLDRAEMTSNGVVGSRCPEAVGQLDVRSLVVAADGKMLVGANYPHPTNKICLARLTMSGALDESFGNGGYVTLDALDLGGTRSLAILPDKKIIISGTKGTRLEQSIELARLLDNGALDSSFGSNGRVPVNIGATGKAVAAAIIVLKDGFIINGHTIDSVLANGQVRGLKVFVARTNPNGALDPSFNGGSGYAEVEIQNQYDTFAGQVVLDEKGNFALVANAYNGLESLWYGYTTRFMSDGSASVKAPPTSVPRTPNNKYAFGFDLALDNDQEVVAGQEDAVPAERVGTRSVRTKGQSVYRPGEVVGQFSAIVVDSDHRRLVTGASSGDNFVLERLTAADKPDTTFGTDGRAEIPGGTPVKLIEGRAVAITADKRIVVAGVTQSGEVGIARYWP